MIWIALTAGYLAFFAFVWCACILAGRADARDHALDDSAEWLGVGSDSFPHERSNER